MPNKPLQETTVYSMTGYANIQHSTRAGTLNLELRSVNSRFLDLHFRVADDLRHLEHIVREQLTAKLIRGKVECRLGWNRSDKNSSGIPTIDLEQISQLAALEQSIQDILPRAGGFRVTEILNWPGVVQDTSLSNDELQQTALSLCSTALEVLKQTRAREGAQTVQVLEQKRSEMQSIVVQLTSKLPDFLNAYELKIRERMRDFFAQVIQEKAGHLSIADLEERVRHEVALHSVRVDVQEELDRLNSHLVEIQRILNKGGPVGKRLDFVTQELNREANTLGSKAHAIAQTQASIDLKVLIEQFKEQVQNLE